MGRGGFLNQFHTKLNKQKQRAVCKPCLFFFLILKRLKYAAKCQNTKAKKKLKLLFSFWFYLH